MPYTVEAYKEKRKNNKDYLIDFDKFNRILSLELNEKSKENVLRGIKELEKRPEILVAEPDKEIKTASIPDDNKISEQWALNNIKAYDTWNIVKVFELKQRGKFELSAYNSGPVQNDMLFILAKLSFNETSLSYELDFIVKCLMDVEEYSYSNTLILDEGKYFVGYFDKSDDNLFVVNLNRVITKSGSKYLVSDPDFQTLYGSEVRFNNGAYQGTSLTIGYTRFIYLDNSYSIPSQSRLDYEWYSSDDEIASISPYGTLLGKSVGNVKIMAVYRNDPSIVFIKDFTIKKDTKQVDNVINISDTI